MDANRINPFVNYQFFESASSQTVDVVCPASGRFLFSLPAGDQADVDHAVNASRQAFDDGRWSAAPPSFRQQALYRFADLIEAEGDALDKLDAEEMGKPISVSLANAASGAALVRFYADGASKIVGDVYSSDPTTLITQRRVPRGVVAAITPWNFPTHSALLKVVPAMAAGNTVVLKPSELSPRSALRLARLAEQAGIPQGVFNVVPGVGASVGQALAQHRDVDMLTFTGSTEVGKSILQSAGQSNMKNVLAECGGKSPQIVFDDGVDLEAAADSIASSILTNQGQICVAGSRLLVHSKVEAALLEKLVSRFNDIVVGDPLDPRTTFGPIVSEKQYAKIHRYIEGAREAGAELVTGGQPLLPDSGGYFIQPTILRNVSARSAVAQEEIFGPVLSVISFETQEQAIHLANSTDYGLMAYLWTSQLTTGMQVAKAIRSSVIVNGAPAVGEGAGYAPSFEPFGQSGIGTEAGLAGLEGYLQRQLLCFNHG